MRPDLLYLEDLAAAARAVGRFMAGVEEAAFVEDELLQSAVLYKLVTLGEAAARISPETREAMPGIPWRAVVGFRNFAVHEYFGLDLAIVWHTAIVQVPLLLAAVEGVLGEDGQG
ncbi:MAG: HepT-like ribonuclease domain-containing protein [Pseudomonadota bacterium]